ncbi:hypothetical protein Slin15195_G045900 [Septoria linicola]|uniref:C2H2-type domain-containing protein n=1 Tax=Septoria linicola TaxID=215465 RepID=A0A9Q9EGZ1_9PEZI|nr:hypothetical protein Slin14017_G049420 [Septoria linicola]USW51271.1 hypothetical protein Slin15195_G045900 [Septoria linicola]
MHQPQDNRWHCQHEGCGRSFTRHEHLQRHVLNHADGDYTCDRCRAHFKRPDLLERHIARHRRKDAEGGQLMTRKRLWKDVDGSIVAKRPSLAKAGEPDLPLSPPGSNSETRTSVADQETHDLGLDLTDELFWQSSMPPVYDSALDNQLFDDIFLPDTASSFNMPYTTQSNYNWLFDLSTPPAPIPLQYSQPMVPTATMVAPQADALPSPSTTSGSKNGHEVNLSTINSVTPRLEKDQGTRSSDDQGAERRSTQRRDLPTLRDTTSLAQALVEKPLGLLSPQVQLPRLDELSRERILGLLECLSPIMPDGSSMCFDDPLLSLASMQSYLDLYFTRFNTSYPLIHLATFEPNEAEPILLVAVLLLGATHADKSAHQLAVCIHDVLRPQIFSNPGFNAKPELWVLQTILLTECLGKSRAGQIQHDMSHLFHGMLINLIRRSDCQIARADTQESTREDLDKRWRTWAELEQRKRLAQICFVMDVQHAVLFSQSLCMSAFELRSPLPCHQAVWEASSPAEWRVACAQQKKQPPLLLAVLKAYLTTPDATYRAALDSLSRRIVLHALMSISWDMTRRDQTSLRVIDGDISVRSWRDRMSKSYNAWKEDMDFFVQHETNKTSDQAALRVSTGLCNPDRGTQEPNPASSLQSALPQQGYEDFIVAYGSLYHAAQICLLAEVLDLQIYAGARHILGRPVTRADYTRSQKVVKRWANECSDSAASAAWHSAMILREASQRSEGIVAHSYHHPWVLFLATLTIWSFFHARPLPPGLSAADDDEVIWNPKEHMHALLEHMNTTPLDKLAVKWPQSGRNCTVSLTAVVVDWLSKVRWGVIHDGMAVLKGLISSRLINEGGESI